MRSFIYKFLVLIAIGIGALGTSFISSAQTITELQNSISSTSDKIKQLELEIKQFESDLDKTRTLKNTLKNLVAQLDLTRKKLEADIQVTSTKVENTDLKIRQLDSEIFVKQADMDSREAALVEALRGIHERDSQNLTEVALSDESFSGFWNDLEAMNQFNEKIRSNLEILKSLKADLLSTQGQRQVEKKNLLQVKSELNDRKKITEDNKKEKTNLLAATSNQESKYAKDIAAKIATKNSLEKELRDYESTLKFILDPKSIPVRGKSVFSPPLDSLMSVSKTKWLDLNLITQMFGKTVASQRLYVSGSHNGTDFRATVGTKVMAMAEGVVEGTGNTDLTCPRASFGKWVFIRYKNGLASTYGHLSLISVSQGDVVSGGSLVGYSGNTGYSTGPHLHVSVYANEGVNVETRPSVACVGSTYTMPIAAISAYLDPMDYL